MKSFISKIFIALLSIATIAEVSWAGGITAVVETKESLAGVWAMKRQAEHITTSQEKEHDIGMYSQPYEGRIIEGKVVIENLPVPGLYDLQFQTKSGGVISGWDPNVPESDYVGDPALEEVAKKKILAKQGAEDFSAFSDRMWVLDIQGNIQNAAVLVMKLRTRPFVGGDYQPGEWVWRLERWQWENPEEDTWVPYRKRPFYALYRERISEKKLREKQVVFARHLGGIRLTDEHPAVDLGRIKIPRPIPGVFAVNPDGSFLPPVILKGPEKPDWLVMPKEIMPENQQAGGAK